MKEKTKYIIGICIMILVIGFICWIMYISLFRPLERDRRLCAESLGINYSSWQGSADGIIREHKDINETNFACCWQEFWVDSMGAWHERKCESFTID